MTGVKTKPMTLRVRVDVLEALDSAGLVPADIARAALEKEASHARRRAVIARVRARTKKINAGFDVVEFLRRERDTHE